MEKRKKKEEYLIGLIGTWREHLMRHEQEQGWSIYSEQGWSIYLDIKRRIDELNNELKLLIDLEREQGRLEEKAAVIIQAFLRTTVVRVKLDRAAKEETNHHRIHELETEVHNIGTEMNNLGAKLDYFMLQFSGQRKTATPAAGGLRQEVRFSGRQET